MLADHKSNGKCANCLHKNKWVKRTSSGRFRRRCEQAGCAIPFRLGMGRALCTGHGSCAATMPANGGTISVRMPIPTETALNVVAGVNREVADSQLGAEPTLQEHIMNCLLLPYALISIMANLDSSRSFNFLFLCFQIQATNINRLTRWLNHLTIVWCRSYLLS
jgi:hypothetical protein